LAAQVGGKLDFETVESALADYFACSFQNDPTLGEVVVAKLGKVQRNLFDKEYIRNLDNHFKFTNVSDASHAQGEVLGGVFWEMRDLIGQKETDKLLLQAWVSFNASHPSGKEVVNFANVILKKAATIEGGKHVDAIRAMFESRDLNLKSVTANS
jgi:hypothetical protein